LGSRDDVLIIFPRSPDAACHNQNQVKPEPKPNQTGEGRGKTLLRRVGLLESDIAALFAKIFGKSLITPETDSYGNFVSLHSIQTLNFALSLSLIQDGRPLALPGLLLMKWKTYCPDHIRAN